MKNKFILIDSQENEYPYLELPLGLTSIGNSLKNNKYQAKIVKITKNAPEKIDKYIDKNTLGVGFGVRTDQIESALTISRYIKKKFGKDLKIIWGGIHTNLYPSQVLENENIDIVVLGDGEKTIVEIIKSLQKNKPLKGILGCGYKNKNKIVFNGKRKFTDISNLPKTDYSIVEELEKYIESSKSADAIMKDTAFFPILSGVGCPFQCTFCYNSTQKERISKRNVNIILDEIEFLQKNYKINFFRLRDELFFYNKKRVIKFLEEKKKRRLNFIWDSSFHINLLKNDSIYSDKFIKNLQNNGFIYTGVGVESGSIAQIKRYKKNINPKDVIKVVKRLKRLKLLSTYAFMVGAPYETYEDMIKTVKIIYLIKSISPEYTYITGPLSLFRPYPGAELYQKSIELGYKEKSKLEDWTNLSKFTGYNTYKDFPYLNTNLKNIFNLFYYLKFIKGLFNIKNKFFLKILKNNKIRKIITNKTIIEVIGKTFRVVVENEIIDKRIIQPTFGRSLILEK